MKTFEISEQQIQEIAGRLNLITISGVENARIVVGLIAVLEQVVAKPLMALQGGEDGKNNIDG